jgi:type II secretory pathway component PulK
MAINIKKQSGFALIFVMVFIAMIMGIVGDVVYQTQITAKNTMIQEDQVLAANAARTGIDFAKFLLIFNKLASSYQNSPLPLPKNLYNILNGQPIGAESFKDIEGLTGIDLSGALSPELFAALKAMKGYFVLNITSENTKFNLNLLQSTYSNLASKSLLRIFSSPDTEKFLALYDYTPAQIVDNLTDYIKVSVTDSALDARSLLDYSKLGLKYLPKHGALESLEELRRIPGFEVDDIYNMFSPYFTIWPINGQQNALNINSAPTELIASIMTPQSQEPQGQNWDKFDDNRIKNTFAQNNIGSWLQSNLQGFSEDKEADEIRKNIFGVSDFIFKIECRGVVNNIEKNYVVVVQQSQTNNKTNTTQTANNQNKPNTQNDPSTQNSPNTQNDPNSQNNPNQTTNSQTLNSNNLSKPFTVLYSKWID